MLRQTQYVKILYHWSLLNQWMFFPKTNTIFCLLKHARDKPFVKLQELQNSHHFFFDGIIPVNRLMY